MEDHCKSCYIFILTRMLFSVNGIGGRFNIAGYGDLYLRSEPGQNQYFVNYGDMFVDTQSSGTFYVYPSWANHGRFEINSGKVVFMDGSVNVPHTGSFYHKPGTLLHFTGGIHVFSPESYIGPGHGIVFDGAETYIRGTWEVGLTTELMRRLTSIFSAKSVHPKIWSHLL
jgi:hypothetical protein